VIETVELRLRTRANVLDRKPVTEEVEDR
jgi:hypothetical protein